MAMVTVVKNLTCPPTRDEAKQLIANYVDELYQLFNEHFGIDGSVENWYWMSFPAGAYAPAAEGIVRDGTQFGGTPGSVRWAFGITDDRPPNASPFCLWMIKSDPNASVDRSPARADSKIKVEIADEDGRWPGERSDEPQTEYLVASSNVKVDDPTDPDLGGRLDIRPLRQLSDDEVARTHAAAEVLEFYFGRTPLAGLMEAEQEVYQAFDDLLKAQAFPGQHYEATRRLHRRYKSWLAAFGSFVDKSRLRISARWADQPHEKQRRLDFFSEEFDANLGYRLAVTLRNVSEHRDEVLNALTMSTRMADGYMRHIVNVGIDLGAILDADSGRHISRTKSLEMRNISGPVDARGVVTSVQVACHRIHARIIHAAANEVREAADLISEWDAEARSAGGQYASFLNADAVRHPLQTKMNLRGNQEHLADLAYKDLLRCQRLDSVGPRVITVHDLIPVSEGFLEVPMSERQARLFRTRTQSSPLPEPQE